ncbi:MAG: hypothetical protein GY953_57875 [bacterium]|nr:hypothetical protein [bacterium]
MTSLESRNAERIENLQTLGYTEAEARFLVIAALHSGHFVRRQFYGPAGFSRGGGDSRLIEKLVANRHAEPTVYRRNRFVYRLASRRFYEALGEGDNRNRRACQPYIVRHKLMLLDFALSRPDCQFLATLEDRLSYFRELGIADELLPVRIYRSAKSKQEKPVYFFDRSPIFFDPSLASPVVSFAFINDGDFAYRDLRSFLRDHRRLFAALPEFQLVFVAPSQKLFGKAAKLFGKFLWSDDGAAAELLTYFCERQAFEQRDTKGWDKARIDRFRDLRDHYSGKQFDNLFWHWRADGDTVVTGKPGTLNGSFETVLVTQNYDMFGGKSHAA